MGFCLVPVAVRKQRPSSPYVYQLRAHPAMLNTEVINSHWGVSETVQEKHTHTSRDLVHAPNPVWLVQKAQWGNRNISHVFQFLLEEIKEKGQEQLKGARAKLGPVSAKSVCELGTIPQTGTQKRQIPN